MNMINKKTWKETYKLSEEHEFDPAAFLNGMKINECSQIQQMLYLMGKKIVELESRIKKLEEKE